MLTFVLQACKTAKTSSTKTQRSPKVAVKDTASAIQDTLRIAEVTTVQVQDSATLKAYALQDTLTILGVGDIMIGTNFPNTGYLPADSGKYILSAMYDILNSADITFGNQEGVILNEGGQQKTCSNPDLCYLFRSPEYLARYYIPAGFDIMSLANNHAGDFGDKGRANTMRILDSLGIEHAGQLAQPYTIFEREKVTYGFAAFSPNNGTQSINDLDAAIEIIEKLDSLSDIIIVSFHGGAEGNKHQHVTREREIYYNENRGNVYEFSHALIDAGADVIFGHGPHVARAIEVYKNKFIAYSLGNFATYGRFNLRGVNGLAPIAKIEIDQQGDFLTGRIISAKQKGEGIPVLDNTHAAALKIKELTEEDFPDSNISIDPEGNIRYLHHNN